MRQAGASAGQVKQLVTVEVAFESIYPLLEPQLVTSLPGNRILKTLIQALVALLAGLSAPIVPEDVCRPLSEVTSVGDIGATARSFVLDLPPLHRDVFVYLVR